MEWRNGNSWNIPASFDRRWPNVSKQIKALHFNDHEDRVLWIHSQSGEFYVAFASELVRNKEQKVHWPKSVWCSKGMPRQQFILWLLFHDSLKTRVALRRRGMNIEDSCVFCGAEPESANHLFF